MKRYNGGGSIHKIDGKSKKGPKRKKPWRARVFIGYTEEGKHKYQTVGYFTTRKEAELAMTDFLRNPYSIDRANILFSDMFDKMYEQLLTNIDPKSATKYKTSFNHVPSLHNLKMTEIEYLHIVEALKGKTYDTQRKALTMLRYVFDLAIKLKVPVTENWGRLITHKDLETSETNKQERSVLELDLIKKIEAGEGQVIFDMAIVFLYTGARPIELYNLDIPDVNLEENYMFLHSKTKSGYRRVPIHPRIRPIIERYYDEKNTYLFNNPNTDDCFTKSSYTKMYRKFIHDTHYIYDFRHTFATYAAECDMDKLSFKRIFGHSNADVTEHYTKSLMRRLQKEMIKLEYK